jgi:adenosine kinase
VTLKYKIAVLGPIPRDHITTYKGEVIEKYGGVNHPTVALARLLGDESTVIPVTHVRKRDEKAIKEILQVYPNVDLDYISSDEDQGDVIQLRFLDLNKRLEKQSGFMNPITPDDVKNLLDCDAFVVVPVTDFEITLDTLKFIKKYSDGLVLFDAHGPTNTLTALGDRLLKFWVDRDNWLPYIDILKMNLDEAKHSWFRKRYELADLENEYEFGVEDLPPFAQYCLDRGVKALYITLDSKGCLVYFNNNGSMREVLVSGLKVNNVIDTTGCGDSFAAGVAFGVLTTNDYIKAARYGNTLGAQRTQGKTFDVFKSFEETEQMIKNTYGD